jgi:hypothetical protein
MIGRRAHGYVILQKADPGHDGAESPDLVPLLERQYKSRENQDWSNVLALLRSGTLGQAITFMVFRDEPTGEWKIGNGDHQKLDLNPDRLAPTDSVASTVDIFVSSDRDKLVKIKEHPLVVILEAVKNNLIVLDAQLPVPAPVDGYGRKQWARIRVALRDADDIGRLNGFLNDVNNRMIEDPDAGHIVIVKAVPGHRRHVITGVGAGTVQVEYEENDPVLTEDLDIVHDPDSLGEKAEDRTWRVLTICADARSNIESDIITQLAAVRDHFELTGLTYALLHGTGVMMLLVHEPQAGQEDTNLQAALQDKPGLAKVQVALDQRLSWTELGHATGYSILRARFRWQDQPKAFLNVLYSIQKGLNGELASLERKDWSVSYALAQVLTGQVAVGHLTICVHKPAGEIEWNDDMMREMGRKMNREAAEAARNAAADSAEDGAGPPENPSIGIYRMLKPRSAAQAP